VRGIGIVTDHFKVTRAGLLQQFDAAVTAGDGFGSATLARALNETNSLIGKLTGELLSSPLIQHNSVNLVMQSPAASEFFTPSSSATPLSGRSKAAVDWLESAKQSPALEHRAAA